MKTLKCTYAEKKKTSIGNTKIHTHTHTIIHPEGKLGHWKEDNEETLLLYAPAWKCEEEEICQRIHPFFEFLTRVEKQLTVTANGCITILCLDLRHGMSMFSVSTPISEN